MGFGSWKTLSPLGLLAFLIMVPVTLPVPVLRELIHDRFGVSEFQTSIFMSINMIGAVLAAPLAGVLVDRFGRQRPILVGALVVDGLSFFALSATQDFHVFLGIRFLEGCAHITALSLVLMMASQALPSEQRGRAMGVVGGCMMLGVALGAPVGGWLGGMDAVLPLKAGGCLAVASVVLGSVVRGRDVHERGPDLRTIASTIRAHPRMLAPLTYAFADRFTVGFFTTTFSLYLGRIHGMAPAQIGLMIAVFMLPFAGLSFPLGRLAERTSIVWLVAGGSVVYGIGTAAVGHVGPPALVVLMFAIGATAAVMFVPSMLMTTQVAPDSIRATALGAFNAAGSLGFIIGPLVGGAVSQTVAAASDWEQGYAAAFWVAGSAELICVALTLPTLLRLRREGVIR